MRLFDRIVCGVDDSNLSYEAARQAGRLLSPGGSLHLQAVAEVGALRRSGLAVAPDREEIVTAFRESLQRAGGDLQPASLRLSEGSPVPILLRRLEEEAATLLALGPRHHSRALGMLIGSVATTLLHDAPCSVLLARRARRESWQPKWVTVGVDGSRQAEAAMAVSRHLQSRFGSRLVPIAATGGKGIDEARIRSRHPGVTFDSRPPIDALLAFSQDADLLVVGSRGLHGIRALGSISERIAHMAPCSVLVVRHEEMQ